jgi:hypothetical protein
MKIYLKIKNKFQENSKRGIIVYLGKLGLNEKNLSNEIII